MSIRSAASFLLGVLFLLLVTYVICYVVVALIGGSITFPIFLGVLLVVGLLGGTRIR